MFILLRPTPFPTKNSKIMAERTAVDENFSRSFRFVPSDEDEWPHGESALSRAVYSTVVLLETVCPEVERGKELELAHRTLLTENSQGFRTNIEVPKYRKDPKKAQVLLKKKVQ